MRTAAIFLTLLWTSALAQTPTPHTTDVPSEPFVVPGDQTDAMRANVAPCTELLSQRFPRPGAQARLRLKFMQTCLLKGVSGVQ